MTPTQVMAQYRLVIPNTEVNVRQDCIINDTAVILKLIIIIEIVHKVHRREREKKKLKNIKIYKNKINNKINLHTDKQ